MIIWNIKVLARKAIKPLFKLLPISVVLLKSSFQATVPLFFLLYVLSFDALAADPVIGGTSASQAVNDNTTLTPFSVVTISDADVGDVTTVVTLDDDAKGVFTPASLSASGFTGSGPYTLAATSDSAAQIAIRQLVFDPADNRVAVGATEMTTFTIDVDDATVTTSDTTTTVISTSINDAPIIGGTSAGQGVDDTATISPFSVVTISDADVGNVTTTVTLDDNAKGVFTPASLLASGFTGSGPYALAVTTDSAAQTAIRQLVFDPADNRVTAGATEITTFTIGVDDSTVTTNDLTTTVVSTSVNDAPIIGGTVSSQGVNDTATISLFSAVAISDVDIGNVTTTVTLDDDAKGVFTPASLSASGFTGSGPYTLAATTDSAAETAIRQLVFDPADNRGVSGSTETTTFTIGVNDSTVTTNDLTTTVISTSVNDAPVITSTGVTSATQDVAYTYTITATDADGDGLTYSDISSPTLPTWLTFIPGTQVLSGMPANTDVGSVDVTLRVTDGTVNVDESFTIVVANVNDAPTIGGTVASQGVNDNATLSPFSAVTFADDDADTVSITVTLDDVAKGVFTSASLTASGFVATGPGPYHRDLAAL